LNMIGRKSLLAAVLIVVILAAGSLATASMVKAAYQTPATASGVQQNSNTSMHLEVVVWFPVQGHRIPASAVNVTVYVLAHRVEQNGTIGIILTPLQNSVTDAAGEAFFTLPQGKYVVMAHGEGLHAVKFVRLSVYRTVFMEMR